MSNRQAHLKRIQKPAGMKAAALATSKRRGEDGSHTHVIGNHILRGNEIVLECISTNVAYSVLEDEFTTNAMRFARWRTRQAANQWLQRRPHYADLHVYDLDACDVLPSERSH